MSEKELYMEMIDSELELVQVRLNELKQQSKNLTDQETIIYNERMLILQRKAEAARIKLHELGRADDNVWEMLKGGMEDTWIDLQSTLEDTVTSFND